MKYSDYNRQMDIINEPVASPVMEVLQYREENRYMSLLCKQNIKLEWKIDTQAAYLVTDNTQNGSIICVCCSFR